MNARSNRSAQPPTQTTDEPLARDEEGKEDREERQARSRTTFEGIREIVAEVRPTPGAPMMRSDAILESARINCQVGGAAHDGAYCKECTRFVNWVPSADRSKVTIRCLWNESDLASDLMACTSNLVTTRPDAPMAEAVAAARCLNAAYLLIESAGRFEGVIYEQDMDAGELVRDRMVRPSWALPPTATLREVVDVMLAHDTDFVPVVANDTLLGVITRADLIGAGLESAFA